jgi:hypothetical protein
VYTECVCRKEVLHCKLELCVCVCVCMLYVTTQSLFYEKLLGYVCLSVRPSTLNYSRTDERSFMKFGFGEFR